ncbi:hypothetical protein OH77DRAFT_1020240 [Trametes cingulata]|nr:hypothetical protein OH77DRAFT_1020240 [Trametes cingulata]
MSAAGRCTVRPTSTAPLAPAVASVTRHGSPDPSQGDCVVLARSDARNAIASLVRDSVPAATNDVTVMQLCCRRLSVIQPCRTSAIRLAVCHDVRSAFSIRPDGLLGLLPRTRTLCAHSSPGPIRSLRASPLRSIRSYILTSPRWASSVSAGL